MTRSDMLKNAATVAGLAVVYFVAGKLGLQLAYAHASAVAVWPCTGIAIAALLVFGYRVWPGILIGAFFVNVNTAASLATSIAIASGNTLEGLAGCYLVNRFAHGKEAFARAQDIFKFALLAGMAATAVSATIGVATLAVGGLADWAAFGSIWGTWWLGDAMGAVLLTPLLLLWWENPRLTWTRDQITELAFLFMGLFSTAWIVFGEPFHSELKNYPFEYLCIPFLVWAAYRFGRRKAATALCALAALATWGTLHGFGPFARESRNTSLLLLQAFMGITAITTLALAAEVSEHRRAEERVRNLAVSDPLTGLANYRQLVEALETEIKRFGRNERPFVLLLLDLDGLKNINDEHGHIVGSRALCRLADMLRLYSREMDTAARYGGDEFVLILPETDAEAARLVAQRISKRLAEDGEEPKISVSIGMAVYPNDGETSNEILGAADRDLYREKGVPKKRFLLPS
ncbi:MAG TPA: MASE1 domain-containing protein [Candidatus Cybelea sp.]|jgi:diguanylate cyclase (GGDEF)-like protein|nr:MASE1 domain-containing protein [Candidatus Cybelea sp.]